MFTKLELLRLFTVKRRSVSLPLRVVYVAVADLYTPVTTQILKLRSWPLHGAGKRVDETTSCPNTVCIGRRMFLLSSHHWWFGSVLHPRVLQFFFNEKRYYVNLWVQLYYFFFTRTPLLFSLAFVYTNRVIYLGFLINLFFSLCMYVYRIGELLGYGSEHGHRQIKSKQHRLGSVLHVLHRIGRGITPYTPSSLRTNSPSVLSIPLSGAHCHMDQQTIPGSWQLIMYPTNIYWIEI